MHRPVPVQVQQLQEGVNGKYKCQFSDGKENISGILTSQVPWVILTSQDSEMDCRRVPHHPI